MNSSIKRYKPRYANNTVCFVLKRTDFLEYREIDSSGQDDFRWIKALGREFDRDLINEGILSKFF